MADGIYVALLGIDGSGKSTVASALRAEAAKQGREAVDAGTEAVLAQAKRCDGEPWTTLARIADEGWRLYLQEPTQASVLTSGLLEHTACHLVRAQVIEPALRRGAVVVSDSFPLKNIVKTLRAAQHMPGPQAGAIDHLVDALTAALGDPFLQPHIGLLLDADPELTHRWRTAQRGELEPGADLAVAGRPGRESFLEFQGALAVEYRAAADRWGWHVLPVDGRPASETASAAVEILSAHPGPQGER